MHASLIQQGLELMLFGMGTVFIFLALLVVATGVMSGIVNRFVKPEPAVSAAIAKPAGTDDERLIAVISAAVHKYRSRRR